MRQAAASGRWAEIEPIFDRLLEFEGPAREAYLDQACAEDPLLRAELRSLLDADRASEKIFPTAKPVDSRYFDPSTTGTRLGPYEVQESIGVGGMGRVFKGRRVEGEFHQLVAIKFLSVSFSDKDQQRFQKECQHLARLDHPNIVHLLDAGVAANGSSYLVLQYVDGQPVDRYLKDQRAGLRERVELFCQLCDAVEYAHRHLIVHRDLKPANVLVTRRGQVKLVDFGISRNLADDATATQSLLTPRYAAPEQIQGQAITTATDIYGLGAVLHEILTGVPPYAGTDRSIEDLANRARHSEPPRPSGLDQEMPVAPRRLAGDLDSIMVKCLQSDPSRRYASVSELRSDLRAWLAGDPVSARPTSNLRRVTLALRKHAAAAAGAGLMLAFIIAATAFYFSRISAERDQANATVDFLVGLLSAVKPTESDQGDTLVLPITRLYALGLDGLSESSMPLKTRIDLATRFSSGFAAAGEQEEALRAAELAVAMARREAPDSYDHLSAVFRRAAALTNSDQSELARRDYEFLASAIGGALPDDSQAAALTWNDFGVFELGRGQFDAAHQHLSRALAIAEGLPDRGGVYNYTQLLLNYGRSLIELARFDEAENALERAIAIRQDHYSENHFRIADAHSQLARLYDVTNRSPRALPLHDQALSIAVSNLGAKHPNTLSIRSRRSVALRQTGQLAEALLELTTVAEILEAESNSVLLADVYENLALTQLASGLIGAADHSASRAIGLHRSRGNPEGLPSWVIRAAVAWVRQQPDSLALAITSRGIAEKLPRGHYWATAGLAVFHLASRSCPDGGLSALRPFAASEAMLQEIAACP